MIPSRMQPALDLALARKFLTAGDVQLLADLAEELPRNANIVDLGAGSGTTALCMLLARSDVSVLTIDTSSDALDSVQQAVENVHCQARWRRQTADAASAGRSYGFAVDLLLLDTSHEYRATRRELAAWLPHVACGGLVWLHDYIGPYPGVRRAIDRAVDHGQLKYLAQSGLGWAGTKP